MATSIGSVGRPAREPGAVITEALVGPAGVHESGETSRSASRHLLIRQVVNPDTTVSNRWATVTAHNRGGMPCPITYYYAPMSTAVRTTWAVEELGVPCERVKLDIQKKETKTEAFLKLNPNGQVPLSRRRRHAHLRVDRDPALPGRDLRRRQGALSAAGPQARRDPQVDRLGERRLLRSGQPLDA